MANVARLFGGVVLVWLLVACGGGGGNGADTAGAASTALSPLPDAVLRVDRGQLLDDIGEDPAADPSAAGVYVLSELTTRVPLGLTVQSSGQGHVRINGQRVQTNRRVEVPIDRIADDRSIEIVYLDARGRTVTQTVRTRPRAMPSFTVRGQTSAAGEIALTAGGPGFKTYLLLLDGSGSILYYKRSPDQHLSDFKRHRVGGKDYYSYMQGVRILPIGYAEGRIFIMDQQFNTVTTLDGLLANPAMGRPALASENHDFLMLGENHFVLSAYYGHLVDGIPGAPAGTRLVSSVLQEIKDGVVLSEWQSTDHPELYQQSEESNNYNTVGWSDYVHFNSLAVDPRDGHFVASFRNLNAIVKIDRNTRQILWRYGGAADDFGLVPTQMPQAQHTATIFPDGSLLFFDNNTSCSGFPTAIPRFHTPDPANGHQTLCDQRGSGTRIVKVLLDEAARSVGATQIWRFANDAQTVAVSGTTFQTSPSRGSVQLLDNGNLFIGFGTNQRGERDVMEWDVVAQRAVFELFFDQGGAPASQSSVGSYRAEFSR